jgi:hypothetical protein
MNNDERRNKIHLIKEKLQPLLYEKSMTTLKRDFLRNRGAANQRAGATSGRQNEEIEELESALKDLEAGIAPLFAELRQYQVRYWVEYDGEVIEYGVRKANRIAKEFYLSTECDINTHAGQLFHGDPDVWEVINELKDYIYLHEYGQFTIQHIRRL